MGSFVDMKGETGGWESVSREDGIKAMEMVGEEHTENLHKKAGANNMKIHFWKR